MCNWNIPTGQANCSGNITLPSDSYDKYWADRFAECNKRTLERMDMCRHEPVIVNAAIECNGGVKDTLPESIKDLSNKQKQSIMNTTAAKNAPASEQVQDSVIIKVASCDIYKRHGGAFSSEEMAIVSVFRAKEIYASLGRQLKGIELTKPKVKKPVAKKRKT